MTENTIKKIILIKVVITFLFGVAQANFTVLDRFGKGQSGLAWGDYDNDGDWDLVVAHDDTVVKLFRNDGSDNFSELAPFNKQTYPSMGVVWGDYNNDSLLDLAVSNYIDWDRIYKNEGNDSFTEIRFSWRYTTWTKGIAWGDYDNDGDLDLVATDEQGVNPNMLYRNDGGDSFTPLEGKIGKDGRGIAWADFNNDGDLDIAVIGPCVLYRNDGNDNFTPVYFSGGQGIHTGLAWGDYDNDGDLDLALANTSGNKLCKNVGNDSFITLNLFGSFHSQCVAWGDFDNDGDLDLTMDDFLWRNDGNDSFTNLGPLGAGTNIQSVAWGDYDNDGDLDLAVVRNSAQNKLLRNELNNRNYIKVKTVGRGKTGYSNRSGIGTKVRLLDSRGILKGFREIQAGGNSEFASMNAPEAHFGAIEGDTFKLVVTWPASGIVDTIEGIVPPETLIVYESQKPNVFSLIKPAKGETAGTRPQFIWHKTSDPDGDSLTYTLYYSTDSNFTTSVEKGGLTDTTYTQSEPLSDTLYYWKIKAVDSYEASRWCTETDWWFKVEKSGITENDSPSPIFSTAYLDIISNPFHVGNKIQYYIPQETGLTVKVLNIEGLLVKTLVSKKEKAGIHQVFWNGTDSQGHKLSSGIYFVNLSSQNFSATRKIVLIR